MNADAWSHDEQGFEFKSCQRCERGRQVSTFYVNNAEHGYVMYREQNIS